MREPLCGLRTMDQIDSHYVAFRSRAFRFALAGLASFLAFALFGFVAVGLGGSGKTPSGAAEIAVLAVLAASFVVFMRSISWLWSARCPSCGGNFFNRSVSVGPFWSYGPWGLFSLRPKCARCGYPPERAA